MMKLVAGQACLRRVCLATNFGFGVPAGRAKPKIGFKRGIAVIFINNLLAIYFGDTTMG
jgi:hypothetical protein